MISITLSPGQLDKNSPGYQAPYPMDPQKLKSYKKQQHRQARPTYNAFNEDSYGQGQGCGSDRDCGSEASHPSFARQGNQGNPSTTWHWRCKTGNKSEAGRGCDLKKEINLSSDSSIAAQEACEKWRLRGNQAYANGDLSKAEEFYTKGVNCVSKSETSGSCLKALMLCHSNRAAAWMSLGRMRNAIEDCLVAAAIDPHFLKVQIRAANCYLSLGDVEQASRCFTECLPSNSDVSVDQKIAVEASVGLQKAQKVSECMHHSAELLRRKTSNDAESALDLIAEALLISSLSEKLLEMKAEALFMLRRYGELIQLCEENLESAEKDAPHFVANGSSDNVDASQISEDCLFGLWRYRMIFNSYFHLGKLEEAVAWLKKQEEQLSVSESIGSKILESSIPLAATVRELLCQKASGNEAFLAGRHPEAIKYYTAALNCNVDSRSFAAVCFCNRAAAYKALGQIIDAIADCSLALALDGDYLKAISRRATLYEMIRDYGQAASDLRKLVTLLSKQVEKPDQSGVSERSISTADDLRQAHLRLSEIEEKAKKEIPLDMYLILGVEPSVSASAIKKAYRKAALRHQPHKAGQVLARIDNVDEIGDKVNRDVDKLFKMIVEAYAILSDPTKRMQYDEGSDPSSIADQETCEKWRLRGNQAYANGDLSKAEEYYTEGVNCVSKRVTSRSCLKALMLCHSNRAATRMSLGRMRNALEDCLVAVAIDPHFLKVQIRAADCCLSLGEVEQASQYFTECLQLGSDVSVDQKIAEEASDGLQKAQKVSECMHHSAELLKRKTSNDAESALDLIVGALLISPLSEKLLEMKAEALFVLRRYEEVIQLCEQNLESAEDAPHSVADGSSDNPDAFEISEGCLYRLWCYRMIFNSYFRLGKLEEAVAWLEKQEEQLSISESNGSKILESSIPLAATVRELLCQKAAGNEAFLAGRHAKAIEHYTAALSCNVDSHSFAAVCFCNRAAAYKELGQIMDAIADCSLAIALDRNYMKAISRRATLYETIKDYEQAASDLRRLVTLLNKQVEKLNQSGVSERLISVTGDLRQARMRLSEMEEKAKKEIPLDMYLILGVELSFSASEIKKAYKKAALRHHPDKAGQALARIDNGGEILEEVHRDADKLFKMIGEAYSVLSCLP